MKYTMGKRATHFRQRVGSGAAILALIAATCIPPLALPHGTRAATSVSLLKDINTTAANDSSPNNFTTMNGATYFFADSSSDNYGLWKTNGTTGGTALVASLATPGNADGMKAINGTLYFAAGRGSTDEIWKSDGTAAGTVSVANNVVANEFTGYNGATYFAGMRTDGTDSGLWKTGGTATGTSPLLPLQVDSLFAANYLYFNAYDASDGGYGFWRSDGTAAGTIKLTEAQGSYMTTLANGIVYFVNGNQLWRTDGTPGGTTIISSLFVSSLYNIANTLYFNGAPNNDTSDPQAGLYKSDGTVAGTVLIKQVAGTGLTMLNGVIYFSGNQLDGATDPYGPELWRTDGTENGTYMVIDANPGPEHGIENIMGVSGGELYYTGYDADHGIELWKSDGTPTGTVLVQDIYPGADNSQIQNWAVGNGIIFFSADDSVHGQEPWVITDSLENPDVTAPLLSAPSWTKNPKSIAETSSLSIHATDDSSGVQRGEYFMGDTDPGAGNGISMPLANVQNGGLAADLTANFGTAIATGVYKISARAQDNAGNWSALVSDYLVVYNPAGPKFVGHHSVLPSLANGDNLPGLIAPSQTDKATFGFNVQYDSQGHINPSSDMQLSYATGTRCSTPARATNCHTISLNATSIQWLTTQGTNNSTGIFQGTATLAIDGVHSQVLFRVTGVDGQKLNATASDQFKLQIFRAEDNPNTAMPLYQVNQTPVERGNIKLS